MTGAVALIVPDKGEVRDDTTSSKVEHLANANHTNVSIKAIQNVPRLFKVMQLAGCSAAAPGDTTLFRDADTLTARCESMRDKVAQNSSLEFTAMLAFTNYLSAGPVDVTSTVIPDDYMEAEPEDSHDIATYTCRERSSPI
jgi:hypothetical protein